MDQNEIIRRLSLGEGFDGIPPERIDTHISTIFLVGDDAYKLKRALSTSYLDYATLEDRHRFCLAELEINRRTAPQIYLDAVPVRRSSDDKLVVGDGPGRVVEWLVHMRRFAQENLFDNMAEAGRLTPALLIELADEIAAFHQSAEIVEDIDAAGRISYVIEQNTRELEDKAVGIIERWMTRLFENSCRSAFEDARNIIDARGAQGFVRHCHGDLHLRNICLIDGKPTLFDAIEFSDDISNIDVLFDLAFLVMDLEHRGLRAEANIVFNRYLYRTGDMDDLSIFPLYQALRAGIRAHVSAMAAATQKMPEDREKLQQDANSYLRLGLKQFERTAPQLIALGGVSGTGKSTIAREIAPHLGPAPGALVLSSDLMRKKILGVEPLTRLTGSAYDSETDQAVYGELMNTAMRGLESGYTVVLDATFIDQ
ncbi:MAG: AAA family ATPase, partial [Verrucomicrobia bacterium]|nr:AAA family ATPase [Verrucomicrobiota bacterium]